MVFPDMKCPNWQPSAESLMKEGLNLLQEKKQIEDRLDEAIKKVFAKLDCDPIGIAFYDEKKIHINTGLQNLANRLQIKTHEEPHSGGKQLVCKWNDFTLFEILS